MMIRQGFMPLRIGRISLSHSINPNITRQLSCTSAKFNNKPSKPNDDFLSSSEIGGGGSKGKKPKSKGQSTILDILNIAINKNNSQKAKGNGSLDFGSLPANLFASHSAARPGQRSKGDANLIELRDIETRTGYPVSSIPRTGTLAGRSVIVTDRFGLQNSLRQLNSINRVNRIMNTAFRQRSYEKPGKRKERIRVENRRREFNANVRRLFGLVAEARRKGY